jgi:hypothetical protein
MSKLFSLIIILMNLIAAGSSASKIAAGNFEQWNFSMGFINLWVAAALTIQIFIDEKK